MLKTKALLLLIIISFTLCKTKGKTETIIQPELSYDTSMIAIIPFEVKNFFGELEKTNTPSALTQGDFSELEKIFKKSVNEHDSALIGDNRRYYFIGNPSLYK